MRGWEEIRCLLTNDGHEVTRPSHAREVLKKGRLLSSIGSVGHMAGDPMPGQRVDGAADGSDGLCGLRLTLREAAGHPGAIRSLSTPSMGEGAAGADHGDWKQSSL